MFLVKSHLMHLISEKKYFSIFLLISVFCAKNLCAQKASDFQYTTTPITPISTPATTPTVSTMPTNAQISTCTATFTNKPTFAHTFTATRTPTFTYTPTATYTPTKSQTQIPVFNCTYVAMGDSWICGDGASDRPASTFAYMTAETLKTWYPGITYENDCNPGSAPEFWPDEIPGHLNRFLKKDIPIGYVVFETGPYCNFNEYNINHLDEYLKGEFSQDFSQTSEEKIINEIYKPDPNGYQKTMNIIIGKIYETCPNVNLVVLSLPDLTCGRGVFPPAVYEVYRQRLYELKSKYPQMRIADIYTAMKGHPEWFRSHQEPAENHPNDLGQVVIAKCILAQFANWPYQPKR
jgi:hypothetical protein